MPWNILKFVGLAVAAVLVPMAENNPTAMRDNICSWNIIDDCKNVLPPETVVQLVQQGLIALIVGLGLWIFLSIAARDYEKQLGSKPTLELSSGPKDEPKQENIPQSVFKDQDIKISKEIRDDQRLVNKIFENCTIYGPAAVWLMRTTIQNCGWHGTAETILLETKGPFAPAGSVIVKDCIFRNCKFKMVSIIAPKKLMPKIRKGFEI